MRNSIHKTVAFLFLLFALCPSNVFSAQANLWLAPGDPNLLQLLTGNPPQTLGSFPTGGAFTPFANQLTKTETADYTIQASDRGYLITFNSASAVTATLNTSSYASGFTVDVVNIGAGAVAITPTTGLLNGGGSFSLTQGSGGHVVFDGTNYAANFGNLSTSTGCALFTSSTQGCVSGSGGGKVNFLGADGTWAPPNPQIILSQYSTGPLATDCSADTSAAFSAAYAAAPNSGADIVLPNGACLGVTSGLVFGNGSSTASSTKQRINIVCGGASVGEYEVDANNSKSCIIRYIGNTVIPNLVEFLGPGVFGMRNVMLDGGASGCTGGAPPSCTKGANVGLYLQHPYRSRFTDIAVEKVINTGVREFGFSTLPTGVEIGACDNRFDGIHVNVSGVSGATGLDIGNADTGTGSNSFDVCRDLWMNPTSTVSGSNSGAALVLRAADALTFINPFFLGVPPGPTGYYGVYVLPSSGNTSLPTTVTFINASIDGSFFVPNTWTPNNVLYEGFNFYGYQVGDAAAAGIGLPTASQGGIYGWAANGQRLGNVTPTLSGGGTGASLSTGSSQWAGQIFTGSSASTTITLTYAYPFANYTFCTVTPATSGSPAAAITGQDTALFTITYPSTTGAFYSYTCNGN